MMRSKATAALIKLKEMDRKYKIKGSVIDEEKSNSSLSDISAMIDEVPKHDTFGSGDEPDQIANRRLKLDIRMPEAHMERGNQPGAQETECPVELVTISDKTAPKEAETPPKSGSSPRPSSVRRQIEETNVAHENVQSPSALSSIKEEPEKSETSISEEVSEVAEKNRSQESTSKSVSSMIDAEEVAKSDPASSITAETYSDDFSRSSTVSKRVDSPRKVESISHEVRRDQHSSGSKDSEIVELVDSPKTTSSYFGRSKRATAEAENPAQTTSRPSSSARSAKERRRSRKSQTASSGDSPSSSSSRREPKACSQNSENLNSSKSCGQNSTISTRTRNSRVPQVETVSVHDSENIEENVKSSILKDEKVESMNQVRVETVLPKETIPRAKNRRLGKQNIRDCTVKSKNHAKRAGNQKTRTRREPAGIREHHLRSRVRSHVQQFMNEQEQRLWARCCKDGLYDCDGFDAATGLRRGRDDRQQHHSFFKPLDLPNVAAFKRPDSEEDETPNLDNERILHLRRIRERILGIRQWLKQQFVLYRDYSSLVSTINAKYIPVTLKETKKMIHDMQRFCVSTAAKNPVLS